MQTKDRAGQLTTASAAKTFALAGNATMTLRSKKTGVRYTYKIAAARSRGRRRPPAHFVSVLFGPDNTKDYVYIGFIKDDAFRCSAKARRFTDDPSFLAFDYMWRGLQQNRIPDSLEIFHDNTCGRCGRPLTVPESVASGFGPECVRLVARTVAVDPIPAVREAMRTAPPPPRPALRPAAEAEMRRAMDPGARMFSPEWGPRALDLSEEEAV